MLNVIELERRWFRYKVKSYIPHAIIALSLSIIIIILLSVFNNDSVSEEKSTKQALVTVNTPAIEQLTIKQQTTPKQKPDHEVIAVVRDIEPIPVQNTVKQSDSQKVRLSPSLDFMKKMQNSAQPYYNNEPTTPNNEKKSVQNKQTKDTYHKQVIQNEVVEPTIQPKERVQIKHQNTQNDIYEIIKRFKKNNNPALSLFVAKKYYELGNYRQAYNYSLMTNKINNEIETSWIIFSKSLVKLGKKEKAMQTLKKYIKHSHSNTARILLDEIQSGKFQ